MKTNEELIQELAQEEALKNPRIAEAFRAIDRARFVPETLDPLIKDYSTAI